MSPLPDADDELTRRLREELDRVEPRFSSPRYLTAPRRPSAWRLAPAALAAAVLGMVGLAAYSGSANPVVWTEHVVTIMRPAAASPTPTKPAEDEHHETPRANPAESPEPRKSPEPSGSAEPRESPEPGQSPQPEPSDDHSGSGSSGDGDGSSGGTSDSGDDGRS